MCNSRIDTTIEFPGSTAQVGDGMKFARYTFKISVWNVPDQVAALNRAIEHCEKEIEEIIKEQSTFQSPFTGQTMKCKKRLTTEEK